MTPERIIAAPSPNSDDREDGVRVDMLVLHYTGMQSGRGAIERLCDPEAKVSAHYVVEEDGRIFKLVEEERRAWHAGVSFWRGAKDINARSVGIEIVNPGHEFGYRAFPAPQMASVAALAADIVSRHQIPSRNVVGHSDVAPMRKEDPGELFDWQWLAGQGVGLWPETEETPKGDMRTVSPGMAGKSVKDLRQALAEIGYEVAVDGEYDAGLECVIRAFQRHWRPLRVDGIADKETQARLHAVLVQVRRLT
ncbi:MAG: N-acetylmuramoyl-L-alanine amidase [Sneathiella sp.]|jgi:N-acetylmuramoyl-L-alanine amidase|uniref:peptidoglycan recognition protein family protein n=1 Tax=Sneathiella sp. TaxID=1964365 RepID=UPI000C52016C|nr:N-acetylmuramoyl-L-alanine amidase [Sneathiella sp.]MAL80327.1 N-acetylmuramoyl-L-alanine amidase [Sneathiella sp.]